MRIKSTFVVLLLAIAATTAVPVTGQEEPLPAIQTRTALEPLTPEVFLAVDPIHAPVSLTLADAVRANDYPAFDALYREAVRRGQPLGAYATLHELWTYSINDPIGAFYGPEMHERLARAYPGYAKYIEDFRIVDSNGNVFYPTSETRTFLLARAVEGGRAPRVQVTETRAEERPQVARRSGTPASSAAGSAASRRHSGAKKVAARDAAKPAREGAGAPVVVTRKGAATHDAAHTVATPNDAKPTPQEAPAVQAPAVQAPVVEAPVVVKAEPPAPVVAQPIQRADNVGSRGLLLLVIGLIGIGLLAMMLRAPREVPTSIMAPPDKVEPIRRPTPAPAAAATGSTAAPTPTPSEKNRANGSHG